MGYASDTYARIQREQYDDWLNRFYPKQKELMTKMQDGSLLKEQLGRVDQNMQSSIQAAEQGNTNRMARYGLSDADGGVNNAKAALGAVAAKNGLRDYERERSMQVLSGSGMGMNQ
ncbi:hypothetical protein [Vibrio metschnikovii]|uniref:hypothetical protein n=1 Tax=Vibrio metschnikovii TaxID=28172 RepID=UPI002FC6D405